MGNLRYLHIPAISLHIPLIILSNLFFVNIEIQSMI